MLLLRIEDPAERGCYYFRDTLIAGYAAHFEGECPLDDDIHPEPPYDTLLAPVWKQILLGSHPAISSLQYRFAFASVEQFHHWFYTEESRAILSREGFHVSLIEVEECNVVVGSAQAVFDNRLARRVGKFACCLPVETASAIVEAVASGSVSYLAVNSDRRMRARKRAEAQAPQAA